MYNINSQIRKVFKKNKFEFYSKILTSDKPQAAKIVKSIQAGIITSHAQELVETPVSLQMRWA